jgi:hypothetical protein
LEIQIQQFGNPKTTVAVVFLLSCGAAGLLSIQLQAVFSCCGATGLLAVFSLSSIFGITSNSTSNPNGKLLNH